MRMNNDKHMRFFNHLVCLSCKSPRLIENIKTIACRDCGSTFKVINNVPCFVSADLEQFSEIAHSERDKFLEMKRSAYSGEGVVSRMYNHYHRYAAEKRREYSNNGITIDVGFGIGEHYPYIDGNEHFIGIDLDRFKLEHFAATHPEIAVLQASAFNLPIAASSADTVQLLATLEHFSVNEIALLLDESLRILKPGGLLITCYPAEGGLSLRFFQILMHQYLKVVSGFDLEQGAVHRHLTGAAEIRDTLGKRKELERLESSFYPLGVRSVNFSLFVNELYRKR